MALPSEKFDISYFFKGMRGMEDQSFTQEVEQSQEVVLVDFYTTTCQPCKAIERIVERISQAYEGRALCARLDVEKNPATAKKYKIMGVPALMLFVNGEQKKKLLGPQNEEALRFLLDFGLGSQG